MKKIKVLLIIPIIVLITVFAGCGENAKNKTATVILNLGNGIVETKSVLKHSPLAEQLLDAKKIGCNFNGWYENSGLTIPLGKGKNVQQISTVYASWEIDMLDLPVFNIYLDGTSLNNVNRTDYVNATISVLNTEEEYIIENVATEFRGRGNGSWSVPKKSWRLKLGTAAPLLGNAPNRHWALVANGTENSMMRNTSAYTLATEVFDGIEYTTTCNFVELFVNDEYRGVYSLFHHVKTGEDRVDITTDRDQIDTGYLLEYDAYIIGEGGQEGIDYFVVDGLKYPFAVKSPDPDDYYGDINRENGNRYALHPEQVQFIKEYMVQVWEAIRDQDFVAFENLVDVDSFVDMYIIHELFKNTDTGWSSFYVYKKPGGKLFAGPVWDFDMTAGRSRGDASYEGLYVATEFDENLVPKTSSEIFINLMKNSDFVELVKNRWHEISFDVARTITDIFCQEIFDSPAFARNWEMWNPAVDFKAEMQNLKTWLYCRVVWLTVYWA